MKIFYLKTITFSLIALVLANLSVINRVNAANNQQDSTAAAKDFAVSEANLILSKARSAASEAEFINFLKQKTHQIIAVNYMGLWVLGSNRTKFSKEQLQTFLEGFHDRLTEFYGSIIYQNKDKSFNFKSVTMNGANKATVEFNIPLDKQVLTLDWQIRNSPKENKLLVTDFVINGISFLQAKRSEYNALFQKSGSNPDKFISLFEKTNTSSKAK